jgi:hypothetical protein
MWRNVARRLVVCTLSAAISISASKAYDVTNSMNTQLKLPHASLELYIPGPGQEYKLLDALVKSGSFDIGQSGMLTNERILQIPAPGGKGGAAYLVFSQHFDKSTARRVALRRMAATKSLVIGAPVTLEMNAVEHIVGDWGWESGAARNIETVSGRSIQTLISKKMSVSFLKIGYVGQTANVAFFPAGTSLAQVLADAKADPNLAGASIFLDKTHNQYIVYSEFFRTPHARAAVSATGEMAGLVLDHQPAIVVQNYESR